ncbi:MAG: ABC transporter permease [Gemmatimonadetes bacterium]|nr:ABC transporter permease [Gemmatimonadota bacterium]
MTLATLVAANLRRRLRRSILTTLGIAIALFLFITLRSVITTMRAAGEVGSETRLVVRNKLGIVFPLPMAYRSRLEAMDVVTSVTWANWFGGVYLSERNFFPQFAIDAGSYLPLHPEVQLPEEQRAAFLAERTAAVVARDLAERFGWKLGQTIALRGTIFSGEHRFTIRGIYEPATPPFQNIFFFRWDYLKERYRESEYMSNVGWYIVGVRNPDDAARIGETIDRMYENSAAPTRSETERAFQLGFISLYGNVAFFLNVIGMAVVFAILLVAANTMAMSARERFHEVAVLKTLGFSDRTVLWLVLAEAGVIAGTGLALGLAGALLFYNVRGFDAAGFIPGLSVARDTIALSVAIAALLAAVSAAVPAWQSARLQVVDALRPAA